LRDAGLPGHIGGQNCPELCKSLPGNRRGRGAGVAIYRSKPIIFDVSKAAVIKIEGSGQSLVAPTD
jgi:hypothetical protein